MRVEEVQHTRASERMDDVERGRGRVDLHRRGGLRCPLQGRQRIGEGLALAQHASGSGVSEVLALARDAELQQRCSNWRDQDDEQSRDAAERTVVVVAAAEERRPEEDVADGGDGACDHGRDRRDQDVPVADVAELVREHAPDLVLRHQAHQALGDRHCGVLRVAPGRERVRLL